MIESNSGISPLVNSWDEFPADDKFDKVNSCDEFPADKIDKDPADDKCDKVKSCDRFPPDKFDKLPADAVPSFKLHGEVGAWRRLVSTYVIEKKKYISMPLHYIRIKSSV